MGYLYFHKFKIFGLQHIAVFTQGDFNEPKLILSTDEMARLLLEWHKEEE